MTTLSPILLRILALSADGMTIPQIATELKRSPNTVMHQRTTIMDRLGADNMSQAVKIGMQRKLIG